MGLSYHEAMVRVMVLYYLQKCGERLKPSELRTLAYLRDASTCGQGIYKP